MTGSDRGGNRRSTMAVLAFVVVAVGCGQSDCSATPSDGDDPEAPTATVGDTGPDAGVVGVIGTGEGPGRVGSSAGEPTDVTGGDGSHLSDADLEALLARRYEAFWDAYDAARENPTDDPAADFPRLRQLAAGELLASSYASISDLALNGEARREPSITAIDGTAAHDEHRVRIDRIEDGVAELAACAVVDDVRYVAATNTVIDATVTTVRSSATLAVEDGEWKVIRSQAVEILDGVAGCWLTDDADFPY